MMQLPDRQIDPPENDPAYDQLVEEATDDCYREFRNAVRQLHKAESDMYSAMSKIRYLVDERTPHDWVQRVDSITGAVGLFVDSLTAGVDKILNDYKIEDWCVNQARQEMNK
jgi:roadblock/LC7 domain-containing protein